MRLKCSYSTDSFDARWRCCTEAVKEPPVIVAIRVLVEQIHGAVSVCVEVCDDVTGIAEVDNDAELAIILCRMIIDKVVVARRHLKRTLAIDWPVGRTADVNACVAVFSSVGAVDWLLLAPRSQTP